MSTDVDTAINEANKEPSQEYSEVTKTYIILDTNSYSGNFERQMVAFVFGVLDEMKVGQEYYEEIPAGEIDQVEVLADYASLFYGEYGLTAQQIVHGAGVYSDNYASIEIQIDSDLWEDDPEYPKDYSTEELLRGIVRRSRKFCELYNSKEFQKYGIRKNVELVGLRKRTTVERSIVSTIQIEDAKND